MPRLALLHWSGSGTITLAVEALSAAARDAGVAVDLVAADRLGPAGDAGWQVLDAADGIVFAAPTYMGGPPAAMKSVFDATGGETWVARRWQDKLAGGVTSGINAAGDKLATLQSFAVFAAQHGMIWIGQSEIGAPVLPDRPGINASGTFLGLALGSARDGALPPGGADTARLYGTRLARAVQRWQRGA